ncbi:MAG TPA: hypothetical protein VKB73_03235 [Gaiellaceae bacterium]|nr:hypothetical protein [Gaiellaceae bacterium]
MSSHGQRDLTWLSRSDGWETDHIEGHPVSDPDGGLLPPRLRDDDALGAVPVLAMDRLAASNVRRDEALLAEPAAGVVHESLVEEPRVAA